jgi:hypothetical protein
MVLPQRYEIRPLKTYPDHSVGPATSQESFENYRVPIITRGRPRRNLPNECGGFLEVSTSVGAFISRLDHLARTSTCLGVSPVE